ncbi:MAG: enolase C-terminal domain-like protein [Pseudorhodoplanes sp.]|nr:enolase C-terminal domain-like protein [Pseudorhodoplanes sp.]
MTFPLGTSRGVITKAPLLLISLETEEGITGHSYVWCYLREALPAVASILQAVLATVKGDALTPAELSSKLARRFVLIGNEGIVRMATAGFDMAAWDALAQSAELPLATLLGSRPRPIPAYNSSGLGLMPADKLADEAEALLAGGFRAVKLRLGYATLAEDLAAVRAVKARIPADVSLLVDYNQALDLAEAQVRCRALDGEGVGWIEEPIRHDNYTAYATLARELDVPIQIGENFSGSRAMQAALDAQACDFVMPDLERIGGVTGWQRAAALAATWQIGMSSHLYPEISAHLLATTPTCHFLEYVDWANKILEQPFAIENGHVLIPERPGNGMTWNVAAVERYRV